MSLLQQSFYERDVLEVAPDLLGRVLVRKTPEGILRGRIVETEAYRAPEDRASHAFNYKRTSRTAPMFRPGGYSYVYLCYGIHHMMNVAVFQKGEPQAVLIRALEPLEGLHCMYKNYKKKRAEETLCAGPGLVCKSMAIDRSLNDLPLFRKDLIWIEEGEPVNSFQIQESPRVGINYAGEEWMQKPWRYRVKDSPYTSRAK